MIKILVALFICSTSHANEIAEAILHLNPSIEINQAEEYAASIRKYSDRTGIKWEIAVAIFKQESNFNCAAINYISRDFGLGQVNYRNIIARKINVAKLLNDFDYAISQTFEILKELKLKYDKIDRDSGLHFYTRYHSFGYLHRNKYKALLDAHMKEITYVRRKFEFRNKFSGNSIARALEIIPRGDREYTPRLRNTRREH